MPCAGHAIVQYADFSECLSQTPSRSGLCQMSCANRGWAIVAANIFDFQLLVSNKTGLP